MTTECSECEQSLRVGHAATCSRNTAATAKFTSDTLRAALLQCMPKAEYVTLFEVNEGTGGNGGRRADALTMCMWPSRGLEVVGYEIKVTRADWLNELKQPGKADAIARYCDRWVVLAPAGVVKVAELPLGWGLWELTNGKFKRTRQAAVTDALPMPRQFVASLLRSRAKPDAPELDVIHRAMRKQWDQDQRKRAGHEVDRFDAARELRVTEAEAKFTAIKNATGIDLLGYTPGKTWIGKIKLAQSTRFTHALNTLQALIDDPVLRARLADVLTTTPEGETAA